MKILNKVEKRERRHRRVRAKVIGTESRPRLSIYKSNTRFTAQVIDDSKGLVIAFASSSEEKGKTPRERAEQAAATLAKRVLEKGVKSVVFDRGGFQYLGTVKAFADSARAAGLQF